MRGSHTKGGIGGGTKVKVKKPDKNLSFNCARGRGAVHIHEPLWLTCRRRIACAKARGNQAVLIAQVGRQNREPYRVCRAAIDHAVTIERIDTHTIKGGIVGKLIHRQVVGVRPQAELRIVAKVVVMRWLNLYGV